MNLQAPLVAMVSAGFGAWIGAFLQGHAGRRRERIAFLFEIRVKLTEVDRAEFVTGDRTKVDEVMPWLCVAATDPRLRVNIQQLVFEYNDLLFRARVKSDQGALQNEMGKRRKEIDNLLRHRINRLERRFWTRL